MIRWGIDLPAEAQIGPGLRIGHFGGIVVSKDVVIGRNLDLSHGVTIGVSGEGSQRGTPRIGDNVYVAPGAKLFGPIVIGNNVKIGANAVVYQTVSDDCIVVLGQGMVVLDKRSKRSEEILEREAR